MSRLIWNDKASFAGKIKKGDEVSLKDIGDKKRFDGFVRSGVIIEAGKVKKVLTDSELKDKKIGELEEDLAVALDEKGECESCGKFEKEIEELKKDSLEKDKLIVEFEKEIEELKKAEK